MTRLAKEREHEVVAGYVAGATMRMLAQQFGVSTGPIQRILQQQGIERRPAHARVGITRFPSRSPLTAEQETEAVRLWETGMSQVAVADTLQTSPSTVARVLRAAGVAAGSHGQTREYHHQWKGGRSVRAHDGYVLIRVASDDVIGQAMLGRSRYVMEHRLVMARSLGRPLTPKEQVHHINGDKGDNRIENLQLRQGPHGVGVAFRCCDCGSHNVEPTEIGT